MQLILCFFLVAYPLVFQGRQVVGSDIRFVGDILLPFTQTIVLNYL